MPTLTGRARSSALAYYGRTRVRDRYGPGCLPEGWKDTLGVPWGGHAFVTEVAAFQAAYGLTVDGKVGRQTVAQLAEALAAAGVDTVSSGRPRADRIRFRGQEAEVPGVRVVAAIADEGYNFATAEPGKHVHGSFKRGRPTALVLHDSVTRSADACFDVLRRRRSRKSGRNMGLGTGFILSPSGTLYQCVPDLDVVTWHASGWSGTAIGLDVVALLDPKLAPRSDRRRSATRWADRGYIDYTDEQLAALPATVAAICELAGIELSWPTDSEGDPDTQPWGKRLDLDSRRFSGVVAHGMISKARWDGNRALEVVAAG